MDESEISEFHKSLLERTDSGFTLIDLDTYTDLKAIKAIRNAFAHPKDEWSFNSPEIEKLAKALKAYRPGSNVRELFQKSSANVAAAIGAKADALIYSHAAKPVE